ncbi:MAG: hypothetical protein O3A82_08550 [Verrucomicrobia bacterium]|nr:hypothetical protein [Verrucomicrobiota bacterium]MDA1046959.1 hypothetical protein [Verrucomicrobiota bacterium]
MKQTARKIFTITASLATILWSSCNDNGEGDHHQAQPDNHATHQKEGGPNGGRLITSVTPHLEFLVKEDLKIRISAVKDGQVVPIGDQIVTLIGGNRSNPTNLEFSKDGDSLISNQSFPKGKALPVFVTIKSTQESDPTTEKFNLNLSDCPTCDFKEYACVCEH